MYKICTVCRFIHDIHEDREQKHCERVEAEQRGRMKTVHFVIVCEYMQYQCQNVWGCGAGSNV